MQAAQQVGGDLQCLRFGVDEMQGAAIPGDVLLGSVFGSGMAEDERAQSVRRDGDAFDTVGGWMIPRFARGPFRAEPSALAATGGCIAPACLWLRQGR
jgi:hypothetical protein